jgi:hypothetical protein
MCGTQTALEISLHSHIKRTVAFPEIDQERRQTFVGAVPGMYSSALSGVRAMVNRS